MDRHTHAVSALEDEASDVRKDAASCATGAYDRDHKMGAGAYQGGSLGVLAGALSAYYGETQLGAWRSWMNAAGVVLEKLANEGGGW